MNRQSIVNILGNFQLVALLLPAFAFVTAQEGSIIDVASADADLATFVAAVQAAGLQEVLSGEGSYTVFAPTNEAFAAALEAIGSSPADVLANPELLANILSYHIVEDSL